LIPLDDSPRRRRPITDDIIEGFSDIANGWSKTELKEMQQLLCGTPVILDGCLRIMPALPGDPRWERTSVRPLSVHTLMCQSEGHARAGRIPILKESTKRAIVDRTMASCRRSGSRFT
jgi:hypothetical protein